ncbi:MAG: alginate export family protein [Acinetobacter sp.]
MFRVRYYPKTILLIFSLLPTHFVFAETTDHKDSVAEHFKFIRYEENYDYLNDGQARTGLEHIKNIPFGSDWRFTFGGSLRERYEHYSHDNFGVPQSDGDGYLIHRLLLHTDIRKADDFRIFVELGNTLTADKTNTAPPYEDKLDLQQAFLEFRLPQQYFGDHAYVRTGRQEMVFGSQRLISIRDAPGVRRVFDALRISGQASDWNYTGFYANTVRLKKGAWDNSRDQDETLWGSYLTRNRTDNMPFGLDVYYLGLKNNDSRYVSGVGEEKRHSVGMRVFGRYGKFELDTEGLYQFGDFKHQDIQAWGLTADGGYHFDQAALKSRLGLKVTSSSGDSDPNDETLHTYNGLYPKMAYFNQAGLLGTQNMIDVQPNLTLYPNPALTITLAHDLLWRQTTQDAVYSSIGTPLANTAGQGNKYTSGQSSLDIGWKLTPYLNFNGGLVYVDVSDSLKQAGGQDTTFSYLTLTYSF